MSLLTLEAKLERQESSTPWGFRMQGGKDYSSVLTIARVTPGSLAAKCGLQQGDIILKIGSKSSETLKHKDAQDAILSYGNKLDLLLQRGGASQYDKFSTPNISSYQQPSASTGAPASQNYNTSAKPFGASKPTPYGASSPAVDNLSQQTQNLSMKQPADYSKYTDVEDKAGPQSYQSRSFKFLQDTLESGQGPPQAGGAPVRRTNGTAGNQNSENREYDEFGKRIYRPSETFKLIQEQEAQPDKQEKQDTVPPERSRTLRALEKQLGSESGTREPGNRDLDLPETIVLPESETLRLIKQQNYIKPEPHIPEHSPSFKELERQLGETSFNPAPAPVPAPVKAPAAPKPGVWSPSQKPADQAPAAKPFSPNMGPPAPAAPRGPPPKPTGVGATRGKIGDAVIQSGDGGTRIPVCHSCGTSIRGPFVMAMNKSWCPDHFVCANPRCGVKLLDIGFIEEGGFLYCEKDYELYFAPHCSKCDGAIIGECVNALNKQYHPTCFLCFQCKQPIGGGQFHLEDGNPYCENDWRKMFQTMCSACNFPIEPGDKWVEALNQNFHSECFNCSTCQINLEGQPFFAKGGKPYCKKHAK